MYKRQLHDGAAAGGIVHQLIDSLPEGEPVELFERRAQALSVVGPDDDLVVGGGVGDHAFQGGQDACLLYTSDAADERSSVDLGGRRIIKKKIK